MGTHLLSPEKGGRAPPPQFSAHVYCGQTVGWIKMPLGTEVGLDPSDIVLDGDPAPLPKRGHSPQFSADVCCGQTAGWIKMPLGTMVGLGTGNIVLDGDPSPPPRCTARPKKFGPCLFWPNGWMDQNATWYESRPRQATLCYVGTQLPPPKRAHPPLFGPCLLWPNGSPSQLLLSTC